MSSLNISEILNRGAHNQKWFNTKTKTFFFLGLSPQLFFPGVGALSRTHLKMGDLIFSSSSNHRGWLPFFFYFLSRVQFNGTLFEFLSANHSQRLICCLIHFCFNPGVCCYPDLNFGTILHLPNNTLLSLSRSLWFTRTSFSYMSFLFHCPVADQ